MKSELKKVILDLELDEDTINKVQNKFASENLKGHAIVIIKQNDRIVLIRRKRSRSVNNICLPGGNVQDRESFEDGIKREIKEELNLNLTNIRPLAKITNRFINEKKEIVMESFGYIFLSERFTGEIKIDENEIESVNIIEMNNIPPLKFRNDKIVSYVFSNSKKPLHLVYRRE